MAWFKRCKHVWYETSRYQKYGPWMTPEFIRQYTYVNAYCPKCDGRDTLHISEWERINAEQRIKEAFDRMCSE